MIEREKVMRGLMVCSDDNYKCIDCPYHSEYTGNTDCSNHLCKDALAMLKNLEKENKALRKLLDWAVECDFGLDNLGDWWVERFAEEIKRMGYTESLIHLARRYIEVFEGGEDDAE